MQPLHIATALLGLIVLASPWTVACIKLKIYVYNMSGFKLDCGEQDHMTHACMFSQRLRMSSYITTNGDEADYYFIPFRGWTDDGMELVDYFAHIRNNYPWMNRTYAAGQPRHFMYTQGDQGPCSGMYPKPFSIYNPAVSPDVNVMSPNRTIFFLSYNGMRDGADIGKPDGGNGFQLGKDIMIPTSQSICGPLCGYTLQRLREQSIWARPEQALQQEYQRQRKYRMFYAGFTYKVRCTDYTGRGGVFCNYRNRTDYLVLKKPEDRKVDFSLAMQDAEFCYAPLGQSGGDPDRYVPALLFGCIPIHMNSIFHPPSLEVPTALPLEEVLGWHRFGTVVDGRNVDKLDEQLRCLKPLLPAMRASAARRWHWLLYSSIFGSYLGEKRSQDAFEAIMRILAQRVPHGYKPPRHVMWRMQNHRALFPCMQPSPNATVFKRWQKRQGLGWSHAKDLVALHGRAGGIALPAFSSSLDLSAANFTSTLEHMNILRKKRRQQEDLQRLQMAARPKS